MNGRFVLFALNPANNVNVRCGDAYVWHFLFAIIFMNICIWSYRQCSVWLVEEYARRNNGIFLDGSKVRVPQQTIFSKHVTDSYWQHAGINVFHSIPCGSSMRVHLVLKLPSYSGWAENIRCLPISAGLILDMVIWLAVMIWQAVRAPCSHAPTSEPFAEKMSIWDHFGLVFSRNFIWVWYGVMPFWPDQNQLFHAIIRSEMFLGCIIFAKKYHIVSGQPLFAWFCMAWQGRFEIKMCSWPDLRSRRSVKQACMYMKFNVSKHPCFRLNVTKIWPKTWPMLLFAKLWACKKIRILAKTRLNSWGGLPLFRKNSVRVLSVSGMEVDNEQNMKYKKNIPKTGEIVEKHVSKTCFIKNLVCCCLWRLWFEILQNRPANSFVVQTS